MSDFDISELRNLINYDSSTGEFFWKNIKSKRFKCGDLAGCYRKDGYRVIRTRHGLHLGHRIAWAIVYGEWPDTDIDHIDGNPSNNKISNLRKVTHSQNIINQTAHKDNRLGQAGIKLNKNGRFYVTVKNKSRGGYATLDEAIFVRDKALKEEYGEFVRK